MKTLRILSIVLLFIVACNALAAGYSFITDPSGAGLGISLRWLQHSPFSDFYIPGLVLFIVIGLFSLLSAMFLMWRWANHLQLLIAQSILISGWIVVQVIMLQQIEPLHYVIFGIGLFLFISGIVMFRKSTRNSFYNQVGPAELPQAR